MLNETKWIAERFFEKFYFVYLVVMSLSACIFVRADGSGHDRAAATASNRRLCAKFLPSGALKSPCHVHMTPPSCWNAQFWRKKYYLQSFFKVSFKLLFLYLAARCGTWVFSVLRFFTMGGRPPTQGVLRYKRFGPDPTHRPPAAHFHFLPS